MHEIIKKSLEEIMEVLKRKTVIVETDNECSITGLIYKDELREVITQSHINLAEEKIKEERERCIKFMRSGKVAGSFTDGCDCKRCDLYEKEVRKTLEKDAEKIDKWKEVISKLK